MNSPRTAASWKPNGYKPGSNAKVALCASRADWSRARERLASHQGAPRWNLKRLPVAATRCGIVVSSFHKLQSVQTRTAHPNRNLHRTARQLRHVCAPADPLDGVCDGIRVDVNAIVRREAGDGCAALVEKTHLRIAE